MMADRDRYRHRAHKAEDALASRPARPDSEEQIERAAKAGARRDIERDPDAAGIDPDNEWADQPESYREAWRDEARFWLRAALAATGPAPAKDLHAKVDQVLGQLTTTELRQELLRRVAESGEGDETCPNCGAGDFPPGAPECLACGWSGEGE